MSLSFVWCWTWLIGLSSLLAVARCAATPADFKLLGKYRGRDLMPDVLRIRRARDVGDDKQCDTNCTVKDNLPCSLSSIPSVTECPYTPAEPATAMAGPPGDLTVSLSRSKRDNVSVDVSVSILVPQDGSFRNADGFSLLETTLPRDNTNYHKPVCHLFNLSRAEWSVDDNKVKLVESCGSYDGPAQYLLTVRSLPRPADDYRNLQAIVTVRDMYSPEYWGRADHLLMQTVVYNDSCTGTVRISFLQAPDKHNFQSYQVRLVHFGDSYCKEPCTHEKVYRSDTQEMLEVTFHDVGLDQEYYVQIQPDRTVPGGQCACTPDCLNGGYCIATNSAKFNMAADNPSCFTPTTPGPVTSPPTDPGHVHTLENTSPILAGTGGPRTSNKTVYVVLGVLLGVFLVVVCVAVFVYKQGTWYKQCVRRMKHKETPPTVKVRVRILYSQDHRLHRCVVERFITFLKEVCDCDVETEDDHPTNQDLDQWLSDSIIGKDRLFIIGSKGALQKARSVFDESEEDKYKGDSFTKACKILKQCQMDTEEFYRRIRDRISVVRFPYSPSMVSFPFEGRTKKSYTLLSDIGDFVQEIRGRSLADIMQRRNSDVWVALQKAIEDMEDFEKGNQDVVLTPYDHTSTPHFSESESEGFNEPNNSSLRRLLDNSGTSQPSSKDRQNPTTGTPSTVPVSYPDRYQNAIYASDMDSCSILTISEKSFEPIAPAAYGNPSIDTANSRQNPTTGTPSTFPVSYPDRYQNAIYRNTPEPSSSAHSHVTQGQASQHGDTERSWSSPTPNGVLFQGTVPDGDDIDPNSMIVEPDSINPTIQESVPPYPSNMDSASTFTISEKSLVDHIVAPAAYGSPSIDTTILSGPARGREPACQPFEDRTGAFIVPQGMKVRLHGTEVESGTESTTLFSLPSKFEPERCGAEDRVSTTSSDFHGIIHSINTHSDNMEAMYPSNKRRST